LLLRIEWGRRGIEEEEKGEIEKKKGGRETEETMFALLLCILIT
jgi:hypothetical protein